MGCGTSAPAPANARPTATADAPPVVTSPPGHESREAPPAAAPDAPAAAPGGPKTLVTLHFNDVYNLEEGKKEPVGGAARFAGMAAAQKDDPLVLFSGDALNPSLASTFFKVTTASHASILVLSREANRMRPTVRTHLIVFSKGCWRPPRGVLRSW